MVPCDALVLIPPPRGAELCRYYNCSRDICVLGALQPQPSVGLAQQEMAHSNTTPGQSSRMMAYACSFSADSSEPALIPSTSLHGAAFGTHSCKNFGVEPAPGQPLYMHAVSTRGFPPAQGHKEGLPSVLQARFAGQQRTRIKRAMNWLG